MSLRTLSDAENGACSSYPLTGFGVTEAQAGTLAIAPAQAGGQSIFCEIVSLERKAKEVTIEIIRYNGTVNASTTTKPNPNTGTFIGACSGSGAWCRFTIKGSPKKYRAVAIYENGGVFTTAIPAQ